MNAFKAAEVCFIFLGTAVKDTVYRFVVKLHTQCSAFISLHLVCLIYLSCLHMYHLNMLLMCSHNFYRHWSTFSGYFPYKCCDIVWCSVQRNVIYPLFKCVINVRLTCKWYYFNICQTCPAFWCAQYSSTHRCFTSMLICHTLLTQFCSHGNIGTTGTDLQTVSLCMADLWAQM